MRVSVSLVWLLSLGFSSTINAAAINKDAKIAETNIIVRDRLPLLIAHAPVVEREAAPVTEAADSPYSPDAIFKRACYGACDLGGGGPGVNTWATLVRIFKEEFGGGNFRIGFGQNYCVSCSGAVFGFLWSGGYVYESNPSKLEESVSCGSPDAQGCTFAGEDVGPYGGYYYGWNSNFYEGGEHCTRRC